MLLFDMAPAKCRAPPTMSVIADTADDAAFEANVAIASSVFSWATLVTVLASKETTLLRPLCTSRLEASTPPALRSTRLMYSTLAPDDSADCANSAESWPMNQRGALIWTDLIVSLSMPVS
jgi:hypothetical protein